MNVCGTELRGNKPLLYSLTKIKGIGFTTAKKILQWLGLPNETITSDVSHMASTIEETIRSHEIITGNSLTAEVNENIKMLISIGCRKGIRHKNGLPVNGQSTRTNASTVKRRRKRND